MNLKNGFATALVISAIIALSACLASAVNAAQAVPATQPGQPVTPIPEIPAPNASFIKLDRNKDGSLSKTEASRDKDLAKRWDVLDANKDGTLDPGEFALSETPADGPVPTGTEPKPSGEQKSLETLKGSTPPAM